MPATSTVKNMERQSAEIGANNPPANRATITTGRSHAPLSGRLRHSAAANSPNASVESAVICNITDQTWILHRTHGTFVIAGRAPSGQSRPSARSAQNAPQTEKTGAPQDDEPNISAHSAPYALTQISARTGAIDLGDKRTLEFPISARDIAEDLAREINADGGDASYFGVFVCAGDAPDPDELAEARERLALFYASLVASADKQWERTHNVAFISDLERRAARELKLEKDWSYEPSTRIECPACGEKLRPNVAVCRTCGAVLDRAKAAQFGLAISVAQGAAAAESKPLTL